MQRAVLRRGGRRTNAGRRRQQRVANFLLLLATWMSQQVSQKMATQSCGFLANRCREAKLAQIRQALGQTQAQAQETEPRAGEYDPYRCPHCGQGRLHIIARLMPPAKLTGRHDPPRTLAPMY